MKNETAWSAFESTSDSRGLETISTSSSTRNPFTSRDELSMLEVLQRIERDRALPLQARQNICSAIRRLERLGNLPLNAVPANLGFIRRMLAKVHPKTIDISATTYANTKSHILRAFRHLNLDVTQASYLAPLSPAWQVLFDGLPAPYRRWGLSRFMHFCSAKGVEPSMVSQQVFDQFKHGLEEESLVAHPVRDHQTACRLWMQARMDVEGWPNVVIEVPRYQETYACKWDDIHPDLVRDIKLYLANLARPDPLDLNAWPRPFRPASLRAVEGNTKRFLGALIAAGVDVYEFRSLKQLVDFAVFKVAMRWLWDRNGGKTSKHIGEVAWTIRCIAVKHIGVAEAEAAKFASAMASLRVIHPGLSEKNHRLLSSFDSPETAIKLLRLPMELWKQAQQEKEALGTHKAALLIQAAVAIELLIFAPMRSHNLTNLDLERHFNWKRDRHVERLHIHIEAWEVKNSQRLEFVLPPTTSKRIRSYIADWRPLLHGGKGTTLFPGRTGKAKDQSCLSRQITRVVRNATGLTVTPHQFRHIAAKVFLDRHPGAYEVVRRLLGHKNLTTTYQHYAGAETKAAVEHYDDTILELSKTDAAAPRRSLKRLLTSKLGTYNGDKWHPRKW